jgi:ATP-binding cassette, subfamily B, multidrug efflux pump
MKKDNSFNKSTVVRVLSYIKNGHKLEMIFSSLCIIINSLVGVAASLFLKNLIDDYISPLLLSQVADYSNLLFAIIKIGIIFLIGIIASFISSVLMNNMAQSILKKIREEMFEHMEKLPIKYFDEHTHGEVMSYYTNDIDAMEGFFTQSISQIISTIITIISVFFTMIALNVPLTLVVILTISFMYFVLGKISRKSGKYFRENQEAIAKINGYIEEMMNGEKVIKVFNHEKKTEEEFDKINEYWYETNNNANKYANILMPIMGNLTVLQYVIISIVGGLFAIKGYSEITLGLIASFLQLSKSFSQPVSRLAQQVNKIVLAFAGANRIFELLDEDVEVDNGYITLVNVKEVNNELVETKEKTNMWAFKDKKNNSYIRLLGDVRFEDVSFGYKEKLVLKNVSLYAKPGQKIALVGATGAGKTTIANLTNRFYDINNGKIIYDGIDIKKIKKSDLRKSIGIVLQDTNLFTGTILENIKYGNPNATIEEVISAAKLANAHNFIERLPDGYNTKITNNGASLSQGQRQLISIARVALINPPVMILDEATSSIDTRTEKIVQDGMDKLMKDRTVFVIAHRLSTIQNAKAILVMDKGEIIERGTHKELLEQKGVYYELYTGKYELD